MLRKGLILATIGIAVSGIASFSIFVSGEESAIPEWVKNNAKWWSEGQIGESDYISSLQYLINQGIIRINTPITEVVAASTSLTPSDSAKTIVVHAGLDGSPSKSTYYTFSYFVHYPQTMINTAFRLVQGSPVTLEDYYTSPIFILESVPSKDKKEFYEQVNSHIKKSGKHDRKFNIDVDIVAGDGTVIVTWHYTKCDVQGYWTYTDDFKDNYRFDPDNEIEIHDRTQFKCTGFSLEFL